jgi:hypothetical protein
LKRGALFLTAVHRGASEERVRAQAWESFL